MIYDDTGLNINHVTLEGINRFIFNMKIQKKDLMDFISKDSNRKNYFINMKFLQ